MNIDELLERKADLERKISALVYEETTKFREETGVSIRSISINQVNVTAMGDKREVYITGKTNCDMAV